MSGLIRNKLRAVKLGLTTLDSQPIGKAALAVVLLLDLFILISIFEGLADHTRQLTSPAEYIPQHCRDVVIDEDWNESNRLVRTARIVSKFRGSYVRIHERDRLKPEHPVCAPISALIRSLEDDRKLSAELSEFLRLRTQAIQVKSELERVTGAYNTSLLEVIAAQGGADDSTASLKTRVSKTTETLDSLVQQERVLASSLVQHPKLAGLFEVIESSSDADRRSLLEDLRSRNFWHPVKRLGMEMLFLLPLVAGFYFWNSKSIAAGRPFQSLVSSHLLVVVFIPVIFKIAELVYNVIPKKLLRHVIEFLESMKLVAIWHYLLMVLGIVAALLLIYFLQKKLFSREKLVVKRITKGQCQDCGAHLPPGSSACPICGFNQYRQCSHCNKATYIHGKYCKECGAEE
jgi:hypothetical protein